jgi:hypothetical protein
MRTPYGKSCRYYYEDYLRGRETKECRLLLKNPSGGPWKPALCQNCPVPDLMRDNGCAHLVLEGKVKKGFLGLSEKVDVFAVCTAEMCEVKEPRTGCGKCAQHRATDNV